MRRALILMLIALGGSLCGASVIVLRPALGAPAAYSDSFTITGLGDPPVTYTASDFDAIVPGYSAREFCGGSNYDYQGASIVSLLRASLPSLARISLDDLRDYYVQVSGIDGATDLLSWGEIDERINGNTFRNEPIIAYQSSGQLIGADGGFAQFLAGDFCTSYRTVGAVQRITVLSDLPSGSGGLPPQPARLDSGDGLTVISLVPQELSGLHRLTLETLDAVGDPYVNEIATLNSNWRSNDSPPTRVFEHLGLGRSRVAATRMFEYASQANLPSRFGCLAMDLRQSSAPALGDQAISLTWDCVSDQGMPTVVSQIIFRHNRVLVDLVGFVPAGNVGPSLLAAAMAVDGRVLAAGLN